MSVTVDCTNKGSHLAITITGNWTPANGKFATVRIKQLAIQHAVNRILLDMTLVVPPDSAYARFDTGVQVADHFGYPFRIAAFGTPELINHFSENVAANRGARLRVFMDETQALEWLLVVKAVSAEEMNAFRDAGSEDKALLAKS